MPLRFVLDENQRGPLGRAIVVHNLMGIDNFDAVCLGDSDDLPLRATDPEVLERCERENHILVTFNKASLAKHLSDHLQASRHCPGTFTLRRGTRLPQNVEHLALVNHASEAWEWTDRIEFIP